MESFETLTTIVTIVSVIFGILNIVLFFKLWGMTDDVKEILKVIKHDKNIHEDVTPLPIEDTPEVLATSAKQIQHDDPERDAKDAKQIRTMIYIIAAVVVILIILLISAHI